MPNDAGSGQAGQVRLRRPAQFFVEGGQHRQTQLVLFKATLVISVCSKQGAFRVRP
jgi:hypothetical protein